jgi:hypothetical protein
MSAKYVEFRKKIIEEVINLQSKMEANNGVKTYFKNILLAIKNK